MPWDFDRMTYAEYTAWNLGNYRRKVEKWEQIRKSVYTTASTMGGLEMQETEFFPLPYDGVNDEPETDNEEIDIIEYQNQFRNVFS